MVYKTQCDRNQRHLAVAHLSVVVCQRCEHIKQRSTLGLRVSTIVSEIHVVWECPMHIYATHIQSNTVRLLLKLHHKLMINQINSKLEWQYFDIGEYGAC